MTAAAIFDLDGTLIDSHRDIATAANKTLEQLGHPRRTDAEIRGMIGHGVRHLLKLALDTEDAALVESAREYFAPFYEACVLDRTTAFEGVAEALRSTVELGLAVGVATNKPARFTGPILDGLGWSDGLVQAWAAADEVPARKPDPAVLRLAAERLGASQVVYVGDMPVDVATARAFGCGVIAVQWGFGPDDELRRTADAFASDANELVEELSRLKW